MSIIAALKGKGPNGLGFATTAEEATAGCDLHGKTMLVTGCNSGLGRETVRVLAVRGARVVATARTVEKAREALAGLAGDFLPVACELGEPASVRACVATVKAGAGPLDAILCNAGVMAIPTPQQKLGWELHLFTNHIGHFILVTGLLDRLAPAGRVVVTASRAHHRGGGGKPGQTAHALHPGVISTNITRTIPQLGQLAMRALAPLMLKTIPQGAATQCYLATSPAVAQITGGYFSDCNPEETTAAGRDMGMAPRLWQESEALVARLP